MANRHEQRGTVKPFDACLVVLAVLLFLGGAHPAAAQEPGIAMADGRGEVIDRVVAIVGDSAILRTQIEEQLLQMQAGGVSIPSNPVEFERLQRTILEDLIDQQLILQAAARDTTIVIPEERLEEAVSETVRERMQSFGTEAEFRQALEGSGLGLTAYRAQLREQIRRQMLFQRYFEQQQRRARQIAVDEAEVRAFYEEHRERFGSRPATISFRQALIQPEPSDSARAAARQEAQRILDLARGGEDFADLARRYSEDPGSRTQGGDLGWYRRGDGLVREFEDAAFALPEGRISEVVESPFGAHIIQVERVRGPERKIHHILIAAEAVDQDVERARRLAEEIRERAEAGEPLRDLARAHGGSGIPDSLSIPTDQLDELPPSLASALRGAQEGDLLGPVEFELQGQTAFSVVGVVEVRDEGEFRYEDVREQVRERLRMEKLEERILAELRDRTYVEIRF